MSLSPKFNQQSWLKLLQLFFSVYSIQYLTVHCNSYLKILVFLFFHKLFSTLNHLNLWNGFYKIYFKIFPSLEYIGLRGRGFVSIDISSCYQNLAALMLIFTFLSTLLKYMVVDALCSMPMSCVDFTRVKQLIIYHTELVPPNAEHNLGTVNIWSGRRRGDMSGHSPWFSVLGIIVVDLFFVAGYNAM